MNKEYTYIDGKVIIEDEEGKKRVTEYSDNLDEILVQENIIEALENKIKSLEEESKIYSKNSKQDKIFPWIVLSIFTLTPSICFKIIFPLLFGDSINKGVNFIGTMDFDTFASIFYTVCFTPLGILMSSSYFKRNKDNIKDEKGRIIAIESLKMELEKAKNKLKEMHEAKIISEEKGFRIKKVDDLQQIKNIQGRINLYFDLGHNGERYYRYYQKNSELPKRVQNNYTQLGQEIIEEYLEEKGHTLVKTRTRKR